MRGVSLQPKDKVALLEFPDEVDAYAEQLASNGEDHRDTTAVSLNPRASCQLQKHGLRHVNSLEYFTPESHARALHKSDELWRWLEVRFEVTDRFGIQFAYSNALVWWSRWFFNHMLWLAEIVAQASTVHAGAALTAVSNRPNGRGGPSVHDSERYLGWLAEEFSLGHDIMFEPIPMAEPPVIQKISPLKSGWLGSLAFRIGAELHRATLRRLGATRPLMAVTRGYQLEQLARSSMETSPDLPWVVWGELPRGISLSQRLRKAFAAVAGTGSGDSQDVFRGEVWPQILERATKEDPEFKSRLGAQLDNLTHRITTERELFSHRGVCFGEQLANKILNGIGPELLGQYREISALVEVLDLVKPRLLVAPFGRRTSHALGELGTEREIPGLLISHGSFAPVKDDLERKAWGPHSLGLLYGSYSHSALQTPLAGEFAKEFETTTEYVATGPLVWGGKVDRNGNQNLKAKLLGTNSASRLIVHAGTPKFRSGTHFHIFELPDEYMEGITDLIHAVEEATDTFLVIKCRPSRISLEEFRKLLPTSDRYCISVDEPFPEVLAVADLLVSFSSTTIEEAFQNRVPVLLYGGGGRYQHVQAPEVTPDSTVEPGAVYWVRRPEYLADCLQRVLDVNGPAPLPEELFEEYVYKPQEITPFPQLVQQLAASGFSGPRRESREFEVSRRDAS